jgi:SH3-like domain-containing protein
MRQRLSQIGLLLCGLLLVIGAVIAQNQNNNIRVLVINEFVNVRVIPAIGAEVIDSVPAGYVFDIVEARSGDNRWLRVRYNGQQGWINQVPTQVIEGDVATLPVADPRSVPYGGFDAPRAGFTEQQSDVTGRATAGVRVRSGPSTGYPTIDNIFFNEAFILLGQYGGWYQVNYDGVLGWVAARYVAVLQGDPATLPFGGVVADRVIPAADNVNDFYDLLRLMRDRVNLMQPSLTQIRQSWTDAALTGRASCQAYPPQPSDFPIPQPLLSAEYGTLKPLQDSFNDAAFNIRQAIDLFIQVCNQPGTGNPVGQATIEGALTIINTAEQQLDFLRSRLDELIPDDRNPGPEECRLVYNGRAEILPLIRLGVIYQDEFTRRQRVKGYCFNGVEGMVLNLQTLPIPPAELQIFLGMAPLDTPDDFLITSPGLTGARDVLGPVELPRTTQYVVLMADLGNEDEDFPDRLPLGKFAFRITNITFLVGNAPLLDYDRRTDSVLLVENPADEALAATSAAPGNVCPSTEFSCEELFSCEEAQACFNAGNFTLDADNDGIPCEATLCTGEGGLPSTATPFGPTATPTTTPTPTPTATSVIIGS